MQVRRDSFRPRKRPLRPRSLHPHVYWCLTELEPGDAFEMGDRKFTCGENVGVSVAVAVGVIRNSLSEAEAVIEVAAETFGFEKSWVDEHIELVREAYARTATR